MRIAVMLDDDIAAEIRRLRRFRKIGLDALINDALRRGLKQMTTLPRRRKPFRTKVVDLGPLLIPIDNVAEAIAVAEGEWYR